MQCYFLKQSTEEFVESRVQECEPNTLEHFLNKMYIISTYKVNHKDNEQINTSILQYVESYVVM